MEKGWGQQGWRQGSGSEAVLRSGGVRSGIGYLWVWSMMSGPAWTPSVCRPEKSPLDLSQLVIWRRSVLGM